MTDSPSMGKWIKPGSSIDTGGSRYSLQAEDGNPLRLVRPLTDAEAEELIASTVACRAYFSANPVRLLVLAGVRVRSEVQLLTSMSPRPSIDNVLEVFVSWLLLFKMTLDQWKAGTTSRYGPKSAEAARLAKATNDAYDAWLGYRVASGGRDRLAHHSLPSLSGHLHQYVGEDEQPIETAHVGLPVSWFLEWGSCPRLLKQDCIAQRGEDFDVPDVVDKAMKGIFAIRPLADDLVFPDLATHVNRVGAAAVECKPGIPRIVEIDRKDASAPKLQMTMMSDLVELLVAGANDQSEDLF